MAGCSRGDESATQVDGVDDEGRRAVTGIVVTVMADRGSLLVDHDEIPGYMPRMTMEFSVAPGDLAVAREGMRIRGKIRETPEGFSLEEMWPQDDAAQRIVAEGERELRHDTVLRGKEAFREIGENLPGFALYDQNGAVAQASRFRGRQVVLNFIYARCPFPNMCPLSTTKMMQVQSLAREAGVDNLELVSITLDPEYDTPGVLRDYAEARGIDTANFSFLTGPERAIKDLMAQLGVLVLGADGPLIKHSLATLLIDSDGRIIHRSVDSDWQPSEFVERMWRPVPEEATP
jgi:protein SCO1/2